jgi:hypothetical protein
MSSQKIYAALESLKDADNSGNVAKLQKFIQDSGARVLVYGDESKGVSLDSMRFFGKELGTDYTNASPPRGEGYTQKDIDHIVMRYRGEDDFNPNPSVTKYGISRFIGDERMFSFSGAVVSPSDRALVTYIHELGHQIHYRDFDRSILDSPNPPKFLNKYADSLATEWTAEAFTAWTIAPKAFKAYDPDGYDWIDKLVTDVVDNGIDNR